MMNATAHVPCFNEKSSVGNIEQVCQAAMPDTTGCANDNNRTKRIVEQVISADATGRSARRQGKAFVIHRIYSKIDTDIYTPIRGNGTHPAGLSSLWAETTTQQQPNIVVSHCLSVTYITNRLLQRQIKQITNLKK